MYGLWIDPESGTVTADGVVFKGAGILRDARLAAVSADSTAVLYDGVDAGGRKLFTLTALAKCSDEYAPVGGIPLEQGLFVDLTGSGAEVTFQVEPVNRSGTGE